MPIARKSWAGAGLAPPGTIRAIKHADVGPLKRTRVRWHHAGPGAHARRPIGRVTMLKTFIRTIAIAGAAALLAACIPEFANPITGGNAADPQLVGKWNGKGDGDSEQETMQIEIAAEGSGLTIVLRDPGGATSGEALRFTGTAAEANGTRYINVRPVGEDVPAEYGHMIFRYEAKGAEIHVVGLDNKKIAAAIEAGKLQGTTSGQGTDTAPKVSASGADVAAYLATDEGKAAFSSGAGDTLILTRAP